MAKNSCLRICRIGGNKAYNYTVIALPTSTHSKIDVPES